MRTAFWVSAAVVLYVYAGYPLILFVLTRFTRSRPQVVSDEPTVTLIISAHNEARVIAGKVKNALRCSYRLDRFEIIVVSDGSTDSTERLVREAGGGRVVLLRSPERRGKAHAMNLGASRARGSVLLFTDANVLFEREAIRRLVGNFGDPRVGAVVGRVRLRMGRSDEAFGETLYMRYERWLHQLESDLSSMVSVDGAMFAVRGSLYEPLQDDTVVDDFVTAMRVVQRGYRVRFAADAVGMENAAATVRDELRRKIRMIAGGYDALVELRSLLNPFRHPVIAFQLWSHKLLRWLVPFFLIVIVVSSLGLIGSPFYRVGLVVQVLFYGAAVVSQVAPGARKHRLFYVPYYFCAMNLGAMLGLFRVIARSQSVLWERGDR